MKKLSLLAVPVIIIAAAACGDEKKPPQTPSGSTPPPPPAQTAAPVDPNASSKMAVKVDDEIIRACNLKFDNIEDAPKFDYDSDALTPGERNVLDAVAKCLTTGPLKGRAVQLVGRADPRGTNEYNMGLGARRAHTSREFLGQLGVGQDKLSETSRGELDATGTDESGWRKDRRVDVKLMK
jgi:peptidoglycan-associated lipoprotein